MCIYRQTNNTVEAACNLLKAWEELFDGHEVSLEVLPQLLAREERRQHRVRGLSVPEGVGENLQRTASLRLPGFV